MLPNSSSVLSERLLKHSTLLLLPHKFTFNRDWYEKSKGKAELDEFKGKFGRLSESDKSELLSLVSSSDPRYFKELPLKTKSRVLKEILAFYIPLSKEKESEIWRIQRSSPHTDVPEDERVEDAGLSDNPLEFPMADKTNSSQLVLA